MEYKIYDHEINIDSTHIMLRTDINKNIEPFIKTQRNIIQNQINKNPKFIEYKPIPVIHDEKILTLMTKAGQISNTGPMSAVAGSISQMCVDWLEKQNSKYSIVENGGDIALKTNKKSIIGVYAGENEYSYNIGFKVKPKPHKYGICTSSSAGPSKSFGKTDATIVFSKESSIADSLATTIGNSGLGESKEDIINNALTCADEYKEHYDGVVIIKEDIIGKTGSIPKIVKIKG